MQKLLLVVQVGKVAQDSCDNHLPPAVLLHKIWADSFIPSVIIIVQDLGKDSRLLLDNY
jgi:hypothetical protein